MLPETGITRFIARKHAIAARNGSTNWWRHGMLLERGLPGLVQMGRGRPRQPPLRCLDRPVHAIDELHTQPKREMVWCKMPLSDHPDVAVDYDDPLLLEEKAERANRIKHRGKLMTFLVSELFDGVDLSSRGKTTVNHFHGDGGTAVMGDVTGGLANAVMAGGPRERLRVLACPRRAGLAAATARIGNDGG